MHPATMQTPDMAGALPDHTQLPDKDGAIVTNLQENPQSNMLTECLRPRLRELHPAGDFCIACDAGIYYEYTDPVLDGCRAPDWFYVPGVPPMLDGKIRRSYVLWKEVVKPALLIEYVSGDGSEERDRTPYKGKFWIYEHAICAGYYVIFDPWKSTLEVFRLVAPAYVPLQANAAGRFPIEYLGMELGLWEGTYREMTATWLRVWDAVTGEMVTFAEERIDIAEAATDETRLLLAEQVEVTQAERKRADEAKQREDEAKQCAEAEKQRADRLAAKLRELGVDPNG